MPADDARAESAWATGPHADRGVPVVPQSGHAAAVPWSGPICDQ